MAVNVSGFKLLNNLKGQECRVCRQSFVHHHWIVGEWVSNPFVTKDSGVAMLRGDALEQTGVKVDDETRGVLCGWLDKEVKHRHFQDWINALLPDTDRAIFMNARRELEANGARVSVLPVSPGWARRGREAMVA